MIEALHSWCAIPSEEKEDPRAAVLKLRYAEVRIVVERKTKNLMFNSYINLKTIINLHQ
jgi:hypothetical protein